MPLYVVTIQITAIADDVSPLLARHAAHLERLETEGRLRVAGAFARDDGFVEIFEARDRKHAEATLRDHPLIEAGVAAWSMHRVQPLHGLGEAGG